MDEAGTALVRHRGRCRRRPQLDHSAAGGIGASTWVNDKKVNALWAINQNRNSWIGVAGVGWVKFANNSDSAIVAFTMLGANARLTQGNVTYRHESDNMIHEIYVW